MLIESEIISLLFKEVCSDGHLSYHPLKAKISPNITRFRITAKPCFHLSNFSSSWMRTLLLSKDIRPSACSYVMRYTVTKSVLFATVTKSIIVYESETLRAYRARSGVPSFVFRVLVLLKPHFVFRLTQGDDISF